jgi:hypothetical protein
MKRGRSTGNPTRAEKAWLQAVKQYGCLCCIARGYPHDPDGPMVEAHHLLSGGIRRGHGETIGLCGWHHRGAHIVPGWSRDTHKRLLGPALAHGSVPFHAEFGSDDELMAQQMRLIDQRQGQAA